jgi:hypothetical protein
MFKIDKYAYASKLKRKDPMEKLIFAVLTLGVCLWADCIPVSVIILLLMAWVTVCLGKNTFFPFCKADAFTDVFLDCWSTKNRLRNIENGGTLSCQCQYITCI